MWDQSSFLNFAKVVRDVRTCLSSVRAIQQARCNKGPIDRSGGGGAALIILCSVRDERETPIVVENRSATGRCLVVSEAPFRLTLAQSNAILQKTEGRDTQCIAHMNPFASLRSKSSSNISMYTLLSSRRIGRTLSVLSCCLMPERNLSCNVGHLDDPYASGSSNSHYPSALKFSQVASWIRPTSVPFSSSFINSSPSYLHIHSQ